MAWPPTLAQPSRHRTDVKHGTKTASLRASTLSSGSVSAYILYQRPTLRGLGIAVYQSISSGGSICVVVCRGPPCVVGLRYSFWHTTLVVGGSAFTLLRPPCCCCCLQQVRQWRVGP